MEGHPCSDALSPPQFTPAHLPSHNNSQCFLAYLSALTLPERHANYHAKGGTRYGCNIRSGSPSMPSSDCYFLLTFGKFSRISKSTVFTGCQYVVCIQLPANVYNFLWHTCSSPFFVVKVCMYTIFTCYIFCYLWTKVVVKRLRRG